MRVFLASLGKYYNDFSVYRFQRTGSILGISFAIFLLFVFSPIFVPVFAQDKKDDALLLFGEDLSEDYDDGKEEVLLPEKRFVIKKHTSNLDISGYFSGYIDTHLSHGGSIRIGYYKKISRLGKKGDLRMGINLMYSYFKIEGGSLQNIAMFPGLMFVFSNNFRTMPYFRLGIGGGAFLKKATEKKYSAAALVSTALGTHIKFINVPNFSLHLEFQYQVLLPTSKVLHLVGVGLGFSFHFL